MNETPSNVVKLDDYKHSFKRQVPRWVREKLKPGDQLNGVWFGGAEAWYINGVEVTPDNSGDKS